MKTNKNKWKSVAPARRQGPAEAFQAWGPPFHLSVGPPWLMISWVRGRGTLGRHLIHYILHRPFYKRALCWSGAGAGGADSSLHNSWRDRWMEAAWGVRTSAGSWIFSGMATTQHVNRHVHNFFTAVNMDISISEKQFKTADKKRL